MHIFRQNIPLSVSLHLSSSVLFYLFFCLCRSYCVCFCVCFCVYVCLCFCLCFSVPLSSLSVSRRMSDGKSSSERFADAKSGFFHHYYDWLPIGLFSSVCFSASIFVQLCLSVRLTFCLCLSISVCLCLAMSVFVTLAVTQIGLSHLIYYQIL